MTVTLPTYTRMRPLVRLVYRTRSAGEWSLWQPLPMAQRFAATKAENGFLVDGWSRYALPFIGEATLRYRHGIINGRMFAQTDQNGAAIPVDLRHAEIRIQTAPAPLFSFAFDPNKANFGSTFTPAWRTRWWGTVEQQLESPSAGETVYHCFDGLFRAKRWQIVHHSAQIEADSYTHVRGHPGYNLSIDGYFSRILGNKDPSGTTFDPTGEIDTWVAGDPGRENHYFGHTWPVGVSGVADDTAKWTDQDVIEHALQSSRGMGDPIFRVRGETHLLEGSSTWNIVEGMKAWDLVAQVADRRRGRGLMFPDWADDSSAPLGPLDTYLTVRAQFKDDLKYTPPGGVELTLTGADTAGHTYALDLVGDQRLVDGSLKFGDRMQYLMDYVENNGEPIESLISPDYASGALAKRWTDADATAFKAIASARRRATSRWDPIYQRHGLNPQWDCTVGDAMGGPTTRCDYQCKSDGSFYDFEDPDMENAPPVSSPLLVRMSNDLPLYEGYNYATNPPVRYDAATDQMAPPRRCVMAFRQEVVGSDLYCDLMRMGFSLQMDRQYGFYVKYSADQSEQFAGRFFSLSGVVGFQRPYQCLILTIGVSFGNRVRMATTRDYIEAVKATANAADELTAAQSTQSAAQATYDAAVSGGAPAPEIASDLDDLNSANDAADSAQGQHDLAVANEAEALAATDSEGPLKPHRLYIHHPGLCLWLAHPGAIWELDRSTSEQEVAPALRGAAGGAGQIGILRDDRESLAQLHALTNVWYLNEHRTVSWSIADCGDLPSYVDTVLGDVAYPQLGDLVTTTAYTDRAKTDQTVTCDTPITGSVYDNINGVHTWSSDWSDLDFVSR